MTTAGPSCQPIAQHQPITPQPISELETFRALKKTPNRIFNDDDDDDDLGETNPHPPPGRLPPPTHNMSLSCRYAAQCCARQLRATASSTSVRAVSAPALQQRIARRHNSTEAAAASPKISGIVDQISQLTLLETADLVASLKVALSAGGLG